MDSRFLSTFLEVANTKHFGKAAENLYLTQSAVSARIKLLEEYFNTSLFVRHRNGIVLTHAGEKLVPFAESMALTLNEARKSLSEGDIQYLACAATPNATELFLHHEVPRFNNHFSDLSLRVEMLNIEQIARQLHERTVDIAFTTEPVKSEDTENIALTTSRLALYSVGDLEPDDSFSRYIHIDWGNKITEQIFAAYPQSRKSKFKTASLSIAKNKVLVDGGSLFLTNAFAKRLTQEKIQSVLHIQEKISVTVYLVYLKDIKNTCLTEIIDYWKKIPQTEFI